MKEKQTDLFNDLLNDLPMEETTGPFVYEQQKMWDCPGCGSTVEKFSTCQTCLQKAKDLKAAALEGHEATKAVYLVQARSAALLLAKTLGRPITINDVRKVCPPPEEISPTVLGAVFKGKTKWQSVGFHVSERAHARLITKWILKDVNPQV